MRVVIEDFSAESATASLVLLVAFSDFENAIASLMALFWKILREEVRQTAARGSVGTRPGYMNRRSPSLSDWRLRLGFRLPIITA